MFAVGKKLVVASAAVAMMLMQSTIVQAETITAGSPPTSEPTTYLNTKTGKIEGFMPDIAAEIARRGNFELQYDAIIFSTLIQSVVSGKIDMIIAGMTPNAERAKVIDFSQPVTAFGEGIFVRDGQEKEFKSSKDFIGEIVGVPSGTDYGLALQKIEGIKEVKFYDNSADLARDVALGRVALGVNDYPILKAAQAAGKMKGTHVVEEYQPMEKFDVAFGVKRGNKELLTKIDTALTDMKKDGTLEKILSKWGLGSK